MRRRRRKERLLPNGAGWGSVHSLGDPSSTARVVRQETGGAGAKALRRTFDEPNVGWTNGLDLEIAPAPVRKPFPIRRTPQADAAKLRLACPSTRDALSFGAVATGHIDTATRPAYYPRP